MRSKMYCVNMTPIAWQKIVRSTSKMYGPQTMNKVSFGLHLNQQHNEEPLFNKPINLEVVFYLSRHQKDFSKGIYTSAPPCLSNLYKFLLETIKGILIENDSIICSLTLKKVYDKNPRTEIIITEVQ